MFFFRLRSLPACRWPPLPDAVFAQCWQGYLELDRSQWLTPAEIEAGQLEQVRGLLEHGVRHVPYYRDLLRDAGVEPKEVRSLDEFRRIPLLPRRTYQERCAEMMATQLPPGTVATALRQTSGSSGTPTKVFSTNMVDLWWHVFLLRDLEWCGLDPTGTIASIRLAHDAKSAAVDGVTQPNWLSTIDPLLQSGQSHRMDIGQDPRVQLEWLRRVSPDYLLSYPTNLEALANLLGGAGAWPNLKVIQSLGMTLTPEMTTIIETAFGVPVKNTYSCAEAGYLASPCSTGTGLHVHAENVLLEILDEHDRPCAPGQRGRVFITSLVNFRTPFIRYELGDEATFAPQPCSCGRGLPLLVGVHGKNYPMFRLPDGSWKHTADFAMQIRLQGGHWQHQLVQKAPDHLILRLAIDATWNDQRAYGMRQAARDFFESDIRVDIETHDRLEQPASGKFQSVVRES